MALKSIYKGGGGNTAGEKTDDTPIYTARLEIGDVVEGYITRIIPKEGEEKPVANMIMRLVTGELKMVFTSGNLSYAAGEGKLTEGLYTRIERLEDRKGTNSKTKKAYTTSVFDIQQDDERTLEDAEFEAVTATPPTADDGVKPTTGASNAKKRAEEIAKAVKAKSAARQ